MGIKLQFVLIDNAVNHCEAAQCEVFKWVAVENRNIGILANFDGANNVGDTASDSWVDCVLSNISLCTEVTLLLKLLLEPAIQ